MRSRVAALLLCGACLSACSARVTEVRLDTLDFAVGFVVLADESGAQLRVLDAAVTRDTARALPVATPTADEAEFLLVTLTEADLAEVAPGLDPTRLEELALEIVAPPTDTTYLSGDGVRLQLERVPLPTGARLFSGDLADGTAGPADLVETSLGASPLSGVASLVVPVDTEYCRPPTQTDLRPFGAAVRPLQAARTELEAPIVRDLSWLDDDRILLTTVHLIAIVERNQAFARPSRPTPDAPAPYLSLFENPVPPRTAEQFEGVLISPDVVDGRRELIVYGGRPDDPTMSATVSSGLIQIAWLTPEGIVPGPRTYIEEFHINEGIWTPDGPLLGAEFGRLLTRAAPDAPFTVTTQLETREQFDPNNPAVHDTIHTLLTPTNSPDELIVTTEGRIHTRRGDRWTVEDIDQDIVVGPELLKFVALAQVPRPGEAPNIWVGTQVGDLLVRRPRVGAFTRYEPRFPPRFLPCASPGPDGELGFERRAYTTMTYADGFVFLGLEGCLAALQIQVPFEAGDAPCMSITARGERAEAPVEGLGDIHLARGRPGAVVFSTGRGEVFVTEW